MSTSTTSTSYSRSVKIPKKAPMEYSTLTAIADPAVTAIMHSMGAAYTAGVLTAILKMALADMSGSKAIVHLEHLERMVIFNQVKEKA
jgi:hypothetical protein